ncbi:class I SAM-dependent methyltransferase [Candidatus Nitrosotenuis sp. DW1]|uniref:class I SAM-dependent methyltransferase n=1 Tax=Candidatus Nitrosotenuis sp. DW1 TaxID=2259672 RepID=UPI0015CC0BCD|nr:class I SAM-dependent methyltransferase [Candidatus Nitrosotenuis sp. DW1]QLH09649.1 class I SAM-dependent methyltransferase [Candidatus Nitrosotenuis sp. DW1]
MSNNTEYWNKYAENSNSNYNEEMAKFIRDLAVSLRVQNVLEVGCNSGNDLKLFPQELDVSGIDPNESAIRKASQSLPHFKFKVGSITELPFEDSSFDFVFTRNVLNYIGDENMKKSVNELFRVSRKYILNVEYFSDNESQIPDAFISIRGRNMYKRWLDFKVKIISNVDMHEEIDPKKSKFTLIRKI